MRFLKEYILLLKTRFPMIKIAFSFQMIFWLFPFLQELLPNSARYWVKCEEGAPLPLSPEIQLRYTMLIWTASIFYTESSFILIFIPWLWLFLTLLFPIYCDCSLQINSSYLTDIHLYLNYFLFDFLPLFLISNY